MTSSAELAAAVSQAAEMLDREEHRYVERFVPCPNGCVFDYADAAVVGGRQIRLDVPTVVRVAGPTDCTECEAGTAEDENAEHLNPLIALLREAAGRLEGTT